MRINSIFYIAAVFALSACVDPGDEGHHPDDEGNKVRVVMTSTKLSSVIDAESTGNEKTTSRIFHSDHEYSECSIQLFQSGISNQDPNMAGECLTPINISGYVKGASLEHDDYIEGADENPFLSENVQLFSLDDTGQEGKWIQSAYYDFLNAKPFEGKVSGRASSDNRWKVVTTDFESMDVQFQLGAEFWTLRYSFVTIPLLNEPKIDQCIDDAHMRSDMSRESATRPTVYRNDVQICVKNSKASCEDSDFQWLDMDSAEFVSQRPANVFQMNYSKAVDCSVSETERSGYSVETGGFSVDALLVDAKGDESRLQYWAEETDTPYDRYYHVTPAGETISGNNPATKLDFNMQHSVFIDSENIRETEGVIDWEDANRATIFQNIFLKQIYLEHMVNSNSNYYYDDSGLRVNVEIAFGDEIEWIPPEEDDEPHEQ